MKLEFRLVSRRGYTCYSVTDLESVDSKTLLIFNNGYGFQMRAAYVIPDDYANLMNEDSESGPCFTKKDSPIFGFCYWEEYFSVFRQAQDKILEKFIGVVATLDISKIRGFMFSLFYNHFGR
jgi:hypothetical protein